jgi:hypothetical protein
MKHLHFATAIAAFALATGCATADKAPKGEQFGAALAAPQGIVSTGAGSGTFTLDPATKVLTYHVEYANLSGPAMAAHIHGPADPGANAPPVVPFASAANPIDGTATLTDAQIADLKAGKWYVNVHTAANRGGEIRGQITAKK